MLLLEQAKTPNLLRREVLKAVVGGDRLELVLKLEDDVDNECAATLALNMMSLPLLLWYPVGPRWGWGHEDVNQLPETPPVLSSLAETARTKSYGY